MNDTGHWEFPHDFDQDLWFGFLYRITELTTGVIYLGKKQFGRHLRVKVKGRINKRKIKKESDWKNYTGSSVRLNEAIKINGHDKYRFEIISLHKTRASLVYAEVKIQIEEDVLRAKLPDGTRKYYNGLISGIKFLPPDETAEEKAMKR